MESPGFNSEVSTAASSTKTPSPPPPRFLSLWGFGLYLYVPLSSGMVQWGKITMPYHYIDQGWPLWRWGVLCGFIQVCLAPAFQALNVAVSYWVSAPILVLAMLMAVPGFVFPDQELLVSLVAVAGMTPNLLAVCHMALNTLYSDHREACQSGIRRQVSGWVMGYSIMAMIWGAIHTGWGFRWGIAAQLAYQALQLPYLVVMVPSGWRAWRRDRADCEQELSTAPSEGRAQLEPAERRFVPLLLLAVLANTTLYGMEWATVSAYFYEQHGWDAALVGFSQMIGDVCGSALLALSTHPRLKGPLTCRGPRWASPRVVLAGAFLLWAAFAAGIVSQDLPTAVASQVLMGPLYVLVHNYLVELITASAGDAKKSRRLAGMKETLVEVAGGVTAIVGLVSYTKVSPSAPYIISVFVALLSSMVFATFLVGKPVTSTTHAAVVSATAKSTPVTSMTGGAPSEPSEEEPAGDGDRFWI